MKRNATLAVYLLLVFASGVVVGSLGHRFYQARAVSAHERGGGNRAEEFRRKFIADLRSRIHLRDDQEQKVNAVLDATREAVKQRIEPEMKAIREQQHEQIRALLDEPQKVEYNRLLEERERMRKQPGK